MTALQLASSQVRVVRTVRPRRPPGFALLRLRLAGICNTDLELLRGYYGFRGRPGHEFVADVVEADTPSWVGRRVVGEINLACRSCEWCRGGLGRHCPYRSVLGIRRHPGAFAEFLTLPESNLHAVPAQIPDERAVFTEPLAAANEICEQLRIPRGAEAAVLGDGKLGLLIAQTLALRGVAVSLFGRHRHKMAIAEAAGAVPILAGRKLPRARFDWVVDATGSASGLEQCIALCRPRGTVVCKSTIGQRLSLDMAPVIVNEISLVGSRCGRFSPALRLLGDPRLRTREMISDRFPLAEGPAAFARAAEKGVLKVLLVP